MIRNERECLVSAIMPNYNNAPFIEQAIKGVINQSWKNLELVIVDDGSTDESLKIINRYLALDPRIRLFSHRRNRGVAAALNKGLSNVKGNYVGFCASDDIWIPEKLLLQLECFANHPEVGIVHSDSEVIDELSWRTGELFSTSHRVMNKRLTGDLLPDLLTTNYISAPTVLVKKQCIDTVGLFPDSLKWLEDWVYMVRLARRFSFFYLPKILVQQRTHRGNSSKDRIGYEESRLKARLLMLSEMPEMSRSNRSYFYREVGLCFIKLKEYGRGRKMLSRAFWCNPFHWKNLLLWIFSRFGSVFIRHLLRHCQEATS